MNQITLKNKNIAFQKNYSLKSKSIRISIKNNTVILTIPKPWFFQSKESIEKKALDFFESKSDWILKHITVVQQGGFSSLNKNSDLIIQSREHYITHKEKARELCTQKCKYRSSKMNLQYNNISIKSLKIRWGSCSSKKNLNFSYKIFFLPEKDQNYLIVHELSHLKHMNHSKNFWDLVCETLESEEFRRYKIKTN